MTDGPHAVFDRSPLANGEWAGWVPVEGAPVEDHVGPLFFREDEEGRAICAARVEVRQTNPAGTAHGGFLMALADMSMFAIARRALGRSPAVTVSLTTEFLGPVPAGAIVRASGEVVRAGGSLLFVRGLMTADDATILAFNGVLRKFSPISV